MKLLTHLPAWLKNKYLIATVVFGAIILFFDKNDLFTKMSRDKELRNLEQSKEYYSKEIKKLDAIRSSLSNDPRTIEKYSREKYLMKRDNEDLYIIDEKSTN
jgi:cell division protein FtsB